MAFASCARATWCSTATNRDPSKIYHVAIYIGNGMVAEARSPASTQLMRAYDAFWRIDDLIPYAGRP